MMLKHAVVLATLVAASPCWGEDVDVKAGAAPADEAIVAHDLKPRTPLKKPAAVKRPAGDSHLLIKFHDDVQARPANAQVVSRGAKDLGDVNAIAAQFNLTFKPAIIASEDKLAALETRAANYSGNAQPDLGSMMYISGPDQMLDQAAQALLALDSVEYVYFKQEWKPYGGVGACCVPDPANQSVDCVAGVSQDTCEGQGGQYLGDASVCPPACAVIGACCLDDSTCEAHTEAECDGLNGAYKGDFTNCEGSFKGGIPPIDCANEGCGDPS